MQFLERIRAPRLSCTLEKLSGGGCGATSRGHKLTPKDRQAPYWDVLKDPDSFASKHYSAKFCLDEIAKIRNQTRDLLASFNDGDLERIISFERRDERHEHSLRWILHHLIDHESQHKGQILMLKRLIAG